MLPILSRGWLLPVCLMIFPVAGTAQEVSFTRQIRPILSNKCFACHGPDREKLKAGLRLDDPRSATAVLESGATAVTPGNPQESALIQRITNADAELRMPPAHFGKPVTEEEVELLRRWISQGAEMSGHWAYAKPIRPSIPAADVSYAGWPRNAIDYFTLQEMRKHNLSPSPEADRETLIRRVFLDLTGLPPSTEEADAFVSSKDAQAWETLVEDLLHRPTFGEHWARQWLDLARYADSAGYADDPARTIWPWRDWVIRAINRGLPFDQFTREQLAGDLLDNPSEDQLIATAFHRNTMTNSEGGTNDEEFRNVAVVDRVNTTLAVWMGTTMACAQCHSHKYDPISQEDYFRVFAILNNTEDADRPDDSPQLELYTDEQKLHKNDLQQQIADLQQIIDRNTPELEVSQQRWELELQNSPEWSSQKPVSVARSSGGPVQISDDGRVLIPTAAEKDVYTAELKLNGSAAGDSSSAIGSKIAGILLETIPDDTLPGKGSGHADGNFIVTRIRAQIVPENRSAPPARYIRIQIPGREKILSLAEVQIFSGGNNIAVNGKVTQSSTDFSGPPELAVDGRTDGEYTKQSVTHTAISDDPWWELDLGSPQTVDRLVIWNRTDPGVQSRLSEFRLSLLDDQRKPVTEEFIRKTPEPSFEFRSDGSRELPLNRAAADFSQDGYSATSVISNAGSETSGWAIGGSVRERHTLLLTPAVPEIIENQAILRVIIEQNSGSRNHILGSFRISTTSHTSTVQRAGVPSLILTLIDKANSERNADQQMEISRYYREHAAPELAVHRDQLASAQKQLSGLKPASRVPILRELTQNRRATRIQHRGNYLDQGDVVTEGVPSAFHAVKSSPTMNRLAFANWLVDDENPLTSRVLANRYWESLFGRGIVLTSEEFGAQGELPTHPELLDWMATEILSQQWDTREFLRLIVNSATYRQSAQATPEQLQADSDNRWLARGPRIRLSAEAVRDQALAVSGLLSTRMFGPPVNPMQPNLGLSAAFGSSTDWKTSSGEDRYRRAIYTNWRRSSPYPSMATFDAPNREVCVIRRNQTNTPLQSLVTLNDPVYVEAAQALARIALKHAGATDQRIALIFRRCLLRFPNDAEMHSLVQLYQSSLDQLGSQPDDAVKLATDPLGPLPADLSATEAAAMTVVANVLLNLDEMFLKR